MSETSQEEALEQLLNLVQNLNDKGFLRTIGYLVNEFEDLLDAGIEQATTPKAFKLLAAGSTLKEAAEAIHVAPLPQVAKGLNGFLEGMIQPERSVEVHGIFDILKLFKDPDIRRGLSIIAGGLKAFGKAMNEEHPAG